MTGRSAPQPLPTCPDCGGLLQPTDAEPLTSAEVADRPADDAGVRRNQCLICGYQETAPAMTFS
jgi:hypothetical protein